MESLKNLNTKIKPFKAEKASNGQYRMVMDIYARRRMYRQEVFDRWAVANGLEAVSRYGLHHYGSGYHWGSIFELYLKDKAPGFKGRVKIEAIFQYLDVYAEDLDLLSEVAVAFKSACEDTGLFYSLVDAVLQEERLQNTKETQLMALPECPTHKVQCITEKPYNYLSEICGVMYHCPQCGYTIQFVSKYIMDLEKSAKRAKREI